MRVLVAVASRHASTVEIAQRVLAVLTGRGHAARLVDAAEVRTLDETDAVVLGSAVYYGAWLPDAVALVERCQAALQARPVWLFSSGPTGGTARPTPSESLDMTALVQRTGARSHREFGGRLDPHDLGLGQRLLVGVLRAPVGDFRDWDEIERWATAVADELDAPDTLHAPGATGARATPAPRPAGRRAG